MLIITRILNDRTDSVTKQDARRTYFLSTLIAECSRLDKTPSDVFCVGTIKKLVAKYDKVIDLTYDDPHKRHVCTDAKNKRAILLRYLPTQLGDAAILSIANRAIANGAINLGMVMGYLKSKFEGRYDGKVASEIAACVLRNKA